MYAVLFFVYTAYIKVHETLDNIVKTYKSIQFKHYVTFALM